MSFGHDSRQCQMSWFFVKEEKCAFFKVNK